MYDNFCIRARPEYMPALHKLLAQFYIVEYLAIAGNPYRAVFVSDRLQTAFKVYDAQAVVSQPHRPVKVNTRSLRPAMAYSMKHPVQQARLNRLSATNIEYSRNSAHRVKTKQTGSNKLT